MATLNFKGKPFVQNYHLTVPFHQLVPRKEKSLTDKVRLDDNLVVQGDNLKALKALLPTYAGKVKCVYIDPPYNTGSESWAYNDNVNSPMMQEWLGKVVDREDLSRHDKWLCMMMPRLKLLREFLSDDGAIFISIDDNEVHLLRSLMNEVFGEHNFAACAIWQRKYAPQPDEKGLSAVHEYVLIYARDARYWRPNLLARTEEALARYKNPDNDPRGPWKSGDLSTKTQAAGHSYPIIGPSGRAHKPPLGRQWGPSKANFEAMRADNRIWFGPEGDNVPALKQFLSEVQGGTVPVTLWLRQDVGDNQEAVRELRDLGLSFDSPKPTRLITHILKLATSAKGGEIVLDAFAGSGVTGHAVLALNKADGGDRRFILVEEQSYCDTLTAERIRVVARGSKNADFKPYGGAFTYLELGGALDTEGLLSGARMPGYAELARYVFHAATGAAFDEKKVDEETFFVGSSPTYEVYLIYKPDLDFLRSAALTLERARALGKPNGKRRLVFAPSKFLDQDQLEEQRIDFAQLPFEIYRLAK